MVRRALLHIGDKKTGSTAFQAWLSANAKHLQAAGIHYPAHLASRNGLTAVVEALYCPGPDRSPKQTRLFADFRRYLANPERETVLISSEALFSYAAYRRFGRILNVLGSQGFTDIHVVALFRNRLDTLNASYTQTKQALHDRMTMAERISHWGLEYMSREKTCRILEASGVTLALRAYPLPDDARPLAAEVMALCGVDDVPGADWTVPQVNVSVGEIGCLAAVMFIEAAEVRHLQWTPPERSRLSGHLRDAASTIPDNPFNGVSDAVREALGTVDPPGQHRKFLTRFSQEDQAILETARSVRPELSPTRPSDLTDDQRAKLVSLLTRFSETLAADDALARFAVAATDARQRAIQRDK